ncbi:hypothetical protein PENTCL1PPCAC_19503, partial [Pristionchus entomophagus]
NGEIWMINFIEPEYLTGLKEFHIAIVVTEAVFCIIAVLLSIFLAIQGLLHPPVHMNLVLITAYQMSWIAVSNGTRAGLILFEAGFLPFRSDDVPCNCLILSFLRLYGVVSIARFSIVIYIERCLALRYVRDYEYILPGYKAAIVSIVPYFFFYFAINNLYAQNELRLEHLNQREIRRPSAVTGLSKYPKKFFGDSSKDMYTLSLRLQLDENIWCCRQIKRSNFIFLTGIVSATLFVAIPPLIFFTRDNVWVLMILASLGNLIIPVFSILIKASIAWSLDKMKPLIVPGCVFEWYQERRRREQERERRKSGRVTTYSQISHDSDSKYSREANEYFSQLSSQWEKSFDSGYI